MRNVPEDELFSAYLDGELTAAERARVEQLLAAKPEARQLLDELRAVRSTLQSLPVHKLDEDLTPSVLRLAERQMLTDSSDLPLPRDPLKPEEAVWRPSLRRLLRPRNLVVPAAAVAIALFLTFTDRRGERKPGAPEVAMAPATVGEDADAASRASKPAEMSFIGPLREPGKPRLDKVAGDTRAKREKAQDGRARKAEAESGPSPTVLSTAANVVPPAPADNRAAAMAAAESSPATAQPAAAPAPSSSPANVVVGMPSAPAAEPGAAPKQPAAESLTRSMPAPFTAAPSLKARAGERDKVDESRTLVVVCDVSSQKAAKGLIEQLLAKQAAPGTEAQRLQLRADTAFGGAGAGMGGGVGGAQDALRGGGAIGLPGQIDASAVPSKGPSAPEDELASGQRAGKGSLADRLSAGRDLKEAQPEPEVCLTVDATPDQVERALAGLKDRPDLFAAVRVESQDSPAARFPAAYGPESRREEARKDRKSRAKSPALKDRVSPSPSESQSTEERVPAARSPATVRSQVVQQIRPKQQLEQTTSQTALGQIWQEDAKQRVVFVLRLVPAGRPAAADFAGPKKAEAAKEAGKADGASEPALPARAAPAAGPK